MRILQIFKDKYKEMFTSHTADDWPAIEIENLPKFNSTQECFACAGNNLERKYKEYMPQGIDRMKVTCLQCGYHSFEHLNGWDDMKINEVKLRNLKMREDAARFYNSPGFDL